MREALPEELQLRLIHLLIGPELGPPGRCIQSSVLQQHVPGASHMSLRECLLKAFTSIQAPELLVPVLREAVWDFAERVGPLSFCLCGQRLANTQGTVLEYIQ